MSKSRYEESREYSLRTRQNIIDAGKKAINELLDVAKEKIIKPKMDEEDKDLAADRLKNAAAAKKASIFDAFEILARIDREEEEIQKILDERDKKDNTKKPRGLAESRSQSKR